MSFGKKIKHHAQPSSFSYDIVLKMVVWFKQWDDGGEKMTRKTEAHKENNCFVLFFVSI